MFLAKHSDFIRKDGYRELNAWSRFWPKDTAISALNSYNITPNIR